MYKYCSTHIKRCILALLLHPTACFAMKTGTNEVIPQIRSLIQERAQSKDFINYYVEPDYFKPLQDQTIQEKYQKALKDYSGLSLLIETLKISKAKQQKIYGDLKDFDAKKQLGAEINAITEAIAIIERSQQ